MLPAGEQNVEAPVTLFRVYRAEAVHYDACRRVGSVNGPDEDNITLVALAFRSHGYLRR